MTPYKVIEFGRAAPSLVALASRKNLMVPMGRGEKAWLRRDSLDLRDSMKVTSLYWEVLCQDGSAPGRKGDDEFLEEEMSEEEEAEDSDPSCRSQA